ncbi:hypothetical protein evm_003829 [Chilo suppressalis]|nr:hypothetical protein evm_003829 [Chilo suppressalis]
MSPPAPRHPSYPQINGFHFQMLSLRDDDDDDSHLCIKCNTTIVGLDNYVKHRKQRCGKISKTENKPDITSIDTLDPTYSLGADVFFQSLELQSSVKKTSLSRLTPPIPITKAGLETKNTLVEASTSRDLPRMSPLETNLREEDWIGGHSLKINANEDNQTKFINAVASISGSVKKDIPSSTYSIAAFNDFKADEDFDDSEDSDEDDEEEPQTSGGKWKPPPNYTGGKWRPASPDHEDWDIREEQEHTGGKWKPIMADSNEREDDYDAPPPGHTKGKWVPGHEKAQIMQTTIQTKGSVQYWCGPCNRRLGSRAIYEKHLMSSLHMRKVLPEHELEFSGHLEPMRSAKRPSRPSRFTDDSIYVQSQKKIEKPKPKTVIKIEKKKRKRKPIFVHCSGCKSRVRLHLMGKHLISHYHFRKATDIRSEAYQQLILDNITAIVHQSPFQCSPCKFYTNWLSNFMQHWFSEEHENKMTALVGRHWCSFCKYECNTSQEMLQHMSGPDHSEVVAVINRSMPIIIRKKTIFTCDTCGEEFKYNVEMKRHSQRTGHKLTYTATDDYQELHKCQYCKAKFKSSLTLAAHLKSKHKQKSHFCLVCSLTFNTSEEAKHHRFTTEHRVRKKEILREKGVPVKDLSRKCSYCTDEVILKNILELKAHIRKMHPEIKKRSALSRHSCDGRRCPHPNCSFVATTPALLNRHRILHGEKIWNHECNLCEFKTNQASHMHRHLRCHEGVKPYACPHCDFVCSSLENLRKHVLSSGRHPGKYLYKCPSCEYETNTATDLRAHLCNAHGSKYNKKAAIQAVKIILMKQNS